MTMTWTMAGPLAGNEWAGARFCAIFSRRNICACRHSPPGTCRRHWGREVLASWGQNWILSPTERDCFPSSSSATGLLRGIDGRALLRSLRLPAHPASANCLPLNVINLTGIIYPIWFPCGAWEPDGQPENL